MAEPGPLTHGDSTDEDGQTAPLFGVLPRTRPQPAETVLPAADESSLGRDPESGPRSDSGATPQTLPPAEDDDLALDSRPEPGKLLFGRYLVERPLGQGGMGTVWLVRHAELQVQRALKLIVPEIAFEPRARAWFRREARAMARLSHPNAVTVHDARIYGGVAYIDMEYIRGTSLRRVLRPGVPVALDWVTRILAQLADVLQEAHDLGIVHRDLKPSNLMLVADCPPGRERIKVLDFGLAKFLNPDGAEGDEYQTRSEHVIGTPQYASPEQILGSPVDASSDLYSLAVIVYELVAGHRPFAGRNAIEAHVNSEPPPPLHERNPALPPLPELDRLFARCLSIDRRERPASPRALHEEFLRALPPGLIGDGPGPATLGGFDTSRSAVLTPAPSMTAPLTTTSSPPLTVPSPPTPLPEPPLPSPARAPWSRRALLVGGLAALLGVMIVLTAMRTFGGKRSTPGAARAPLAGYAPAAPDDRVGGKPRVLVRDRDGTRFVLIPGGEFAMGRGFGPSTLPALDDQPAHPVTLSSYYLQETEVTNAEMEAYFRDRKIATEARPRRWREAYDILRDEGRDPAAYPAVGIPREMAEDYARWVSGRLPTEAQWEYAARSGGQDRLYVWDKPTPPDRTSANINTLGDHARLTTSPVKLYAGDRTDQGIFDLTGNVREMCRDLWAPYASSGAPLTDPSGPSKPTANATVPFVVRGGSFATFPDEFLTTARRCPDPTSLTATQYAEDQTASDLGFRVVLDVPQ